MQWHAVDASRVQQTVREMRRASLRGAQVALAEQGRRALSVSESELKRQVPTLTACVPRARSRAAATPAG